MRRRLDPYPRHDRNVAKDTMTVFTRILHDCDDRAIEIPVRVHPPVPQRGDWACHFSIGWPDGELARAAFGIDPIQAFDLALRMIGTHLYTSDLHSAGRLMWLEPGKGYGFPVPDTIRDMLEGDDRFFL
jgi:hypothetical protein